jgi:SAM-dependent methyltransferase
MVTGYDALYETFDSPLMRRVRQAAYGEDIGQHSWVTGDELRRHAARLSLQPSNRLLDLGCGPCGPLSLILAFAGCRGTGVDRSAQALTLGGARAASLGLERRLTVCQADLDAPLPFAGGSFDAAMSLDVVLHLRDRREVFRELDRILVRGGRLLFTDAGVLTGRVSEEDAQARSHYGPAQLVAPGFNERSLERAGFRLIDAQDETASLLRNTTGRLAARLAHRAELEPLEGAAGFARQQTYLEAVARLARRGALSRKTYLAEARGA